MACKTLKIGVFFDGTGNSMEEIETYSNVAKLYDLYEEFKERDVEGTVTTAVKHYEVGIGKGEGSSAIDMASGAGGALRISRMIDRVCATLDAHPYEDDLYKIRQIDIFGFSRGAALARDFVNTFYREVVRGPSKKYKDVRFNFIGLFDTVGSFGIPGNDIDYKPKDPYEDSESIFSDNEDDEDFEPYNFDLNAAQAKKIVHLVAKNELRANFPLKSARGAALEIECLGVHSDIGGGYGKSTKETLIDGRTKEHKIVRRVVGNDLSKVYLKLMYAYAKKYDVPFKDSSIEITDDLIPYEKLILSNPARISDIDDKEKERFLLKHAHQSATHIQVPAFGMAMAFVEPYIYLPALLRLPKDLVEISAASNVANYKNKSVYREIYPNRSGEAVLPKKSS